MQYGFLLGNKSETIFNNEQISSGAVNSKGWMTEQDVLFHFTMKASYSFSE